MVAEDGWEAQSDAEAFVPVVEDRFGDMGSMGSPDFPEADAGDCVSLRASFGVGGLLHVIHNAAKGLGACMKFYDDIVEDMGVLSKFLRERHSKERLISKCFSVGDAAGGPIRSRIETFAAQCYKERWGTVAKCALELHKVLPALRLGWNKATYVEGTAHGRGANPGESAQTVERVDGLVSNLWFESYLLMLQSFSRLVMHLIAWAESCPCHWQLLSGPEVETLSKSDRRLLEECPMRTRRAPELALNDFMQEVTGFSQEAATQLLQNLPVDLSGQDRAKLLRDFELGRSYLTMVLTLKTSHFRNFPWSAAGLAHHEQDRAREVWDSLRTALQAGGDVAEMLKIRLPRLLSDEVQRQGDQWFNGADMSSCPQFADVVASLAMVPVAERRVEAQHARTQKGSKKSPHHSPAYMSLQLRARELQEQIKGDPKEVVAVLSPLVYRCRSYKKACESMKLVKHPHILHGLKCKRDKVLRDALYRADIASQHHPLPQVFVAEFRGRGPRALPPAEALDTSNLRGVLHQLALEHAMSSVQHLRQQEGASPVFAVRYEAPAFSLLREFLLPGRAHVQSPQALTDAQPLEAIVEVSSSNPPSGDADLLFQKLRLAERRGGEVSLVFFQLLPNMHQMKRFRAEGERQFQVSDFAIALMRPVYVNAPQRECLLDSELLSMRSMPGGLRVDDVPCVMSFSNMTLEQLKSLVVLDATSEGVYCLRTRPALPNVPEQEKVLRSLLKQIAQCGHAGLADVSALSADEKKLLTGLREHGLVTQDHPLKFTDAGNQQLVLATQVSEPRNLLADMEVDAADQSRWQLLQRLINNSWEVRVCKASACRAADPYKVAEGDKVLFLPQTSSGVACSKMYLLALTLAAEHKLPVPHARPNAVYAGLLSGLAYLPENVRRQPQTRVFRAVCDGEDWHEARPASKRKRTPTAKRAPAIAAGAAPAAQPVEDMPADQEPMVDDAVTDDGPPAGSQEELTWLLEQFEESDAVASDAGEGEAREVTAASSTSSSSSSTSSSSSSSSSSSGSGSGRSSKGSTSARPKTKAKAKPKAKRQEKRPREEHGLLHRGPGVGGVLLDSTFFWRDCKFTEKFSLTADGVRNVVGLEVTCKHPEHVKCRRTLAFARNGGRDKVITLLKWWCTQARHYDTKDTHVRECPKSFGDPAPTEEELDQVPFGF